MSRWFACLIVLAWAAAAQADDAGAGRAEASERERIARERAGVEAGFAQRQQECGARFAVTACIDDARAEQRAALARLRDQELSLDEARRRQRAFERLTVIEEKTRGDAARAVTRQAAAASAPVPEAAPVSASEAVPRTASGAKSKAPRTAPTPRPARQPKSVPDRGAQEAGKREAFEAGQRAAQARRDAAQLREAERATQKRNAPGLPTPASGAAR